MFVVASSPKVSTLLTMLRELYSLLACRTHAFRTHESFRNSNTSIIRNERTPHSSLMANDGTNCKHLVQSIKLLEELFVMCMITVAYSFAMKGLVRIVSKSANGWRNAVKYTTRGTSANSAQKWKPSSSQINSVSQQSPKSQSFQKKKRKRKRERKRLI